MLSALDSPLGDDLTAADLEAFGYAWMRDVADFANLSHYHELQDDERTAFDLEVREFRFDRPWLRRDLGEDDYFTYRHPSNGTILYLGVRSSPNGEEELLFAANMEGVPVEVSPAVLAEEIPDLDTAGWEPELVAPGAERRGENTFEIANADAVVWSR
jgi:hypothetical protein